jgi:hypothetical protein
MTLNTRSQTLTLLGIGLLIFVLVTVFTHDTLTAPYPGHNDFLSRWEAARSFWQEGLNPYGAEASLNIQQMIYGRAVTDITTEDPGFFAYPMYTAFLLAPLVTVDYAWASAIWMTLLEVLLIASVFLLLDHFRWRPNALLLTVLILWSLLSYFPMRGLLLGQPGHFVYFLEVVAIWGLARKRQNLAGVALAVSTIKPQMGYLLVPFLLLWGLRRRQWRFVGAFIVSFGVLMLASFIAQPTWMQDWLSQVGLYTTYTQIGGPVWVLTHYPWLALDPTTGLWTVAGGFGDALNLLLSAVLYGFMLWTWYGVLIQHKHERLMWTIVMTLTITHLVAPRTASPHFVVFMIPLVFYLRWLTQPKRRLGSLYALLILLLLFVGQWAHFLLTVEGEFEHPTIYLPTPFILLLLLWATRRMWWHDPSDRFQREVTA